MDAEEKRDDATICKIEFDESGNPAVRPGQDRPETHDPTYRDDIPYIWRGRK